jgi:hypothetical protein
MESEVAGRGPLLRSPVGSTVPEASEDAPLLRRLRLIVQAHLLKSLLRGRIVWSVDAAFLKRRARWRTGAANIERATGIQRMASIEGWARSEVYIRDWGAGGNILSPMSTQCASRQEDVRRTKDLRYESKLSREMLKGSFSLKRLRWLDEVVEALDRECQKLGFSGGEGCIRLAVGFSRFHHRIESGDVCSRRGLRTGR